MSDTIERNQKRGSAVTTVRAIAILIIRIWAIQEFITTAFNIQIQRHFYSLVQQPDSDQYLGMVVGMSYQALFFVLAVVFFIFAGPVVRLLLRLPSRTGETYQFSIDDMVRAGTFLIGLYLLGRRGGEAIYALMSGAVESYREVPAYLALSDGYVSYLAHIFVIVFALWLVIFPGHVTRLFSWLHKAGEAKPTPVEES